MVNYFNKLNNKQTIDDENINIYVCGPTVYNHVHIGNLRPILFFSLLRNIFKYQGKEVTLLQNITDIDDKILTYATENNLNWYDVSKQYTKAYLDVLSKYKIKDINFHKATDYIQTYVDCVDKLLELNLAYVNNSGAYLKVDKILKYGEVSNQNIEQLEQSVRVINNEEKENIKDFAILKTDADFGWETKFGKVRPGWHLECFGIINAVLNQSLTIHGGGIDLLFPHHENENALNLALYNKSLAKHWMHVGLLTLNGEKMSKSIGNLILAKDFVKDYGPNVLKLIYLQSNYSKPINITENLINNCLKTDIALKDLINFLKIYKVDSNYKKTAYLETFEKLIVNISMPNMYSCLQKIIKDFNKNLIAEEMYKSLLIDLQIMFDVLDLYYENNISNTEIQIVQKLNSIKTQAQIDLILEKYPNFKKTRKGWTIK